MLGERKFDAAAKAYINDCPSTSFTLRNLGSKLEAWLRKNPKWTGSRRELALDMVRLEWADIDAFDGKAEPALKPEDLAGADPETLRLQLQPYIHLLDLHYPVDDLLIELKKDEEDTDFASNAFNERHKQKRVRAVARLKPSTIFLAVHRLDDSVYFRRLEHEEFLILKELRARQDAEPGRRLRSAQEFDRARRQARANSELVPDLVYSGLVLPLRGSEKEMSGLREQIQNLYGVPVRVASSLQSALLLCIRVYFGLCRLALR